MSDVLVNLDIWDYVTDGSNTEPVCVIENPVTEEDGKTYTDLNNYHNEMSNEPKCDEPRLGETGETNEHDGLYENNPIDIIGDLPSFYSACLTMFESTQGESYETGPSIHQIPINPQNTSVPQIFNKGVDLNFEIPLEFSPVTPTETNSELGETNLDNTIPCLYERKFSDYEAMIINSDGSNNNGQNHNLRSPTDVQLLSKPNLSSNAKGADEKDEHTVAEKSFHHDKYLNEHSNTNHVENPLQCSYCKKVFSLKSNLIVHIRIHTGEKPHVCKFCRKSFTQKEHLNKHIRTHTGEKPFSCETCQKSFAAKTDLIGHTRTHTGEKPYSCEFCRKSFTLKQQLNRHTKTHTGQKSYSCEFCQKTFAQKGNLNSHTRIHTGEKPFSCVFCQKSFTEKGSLNKHTRIHTGEKNSSCEICQKSFAQKPQLMNHIITQHTDPLFI